MQKSWAMAKPCDRRCFDSANPPRSLDSRIRCQQPESEAAAMKHEERVLLCAW